MTKYTVVVTPDGILSGQAFIVEAESEEAAIHMAEENYLENVRAFLNFEFDVDEEDE